MIVISDSDRGSCPFFKSAKEFENELGAKYRRPLILLATFSLIYNFAGVKVTGSGFGIVSGTISNPSIIGAALLIALVYSVTVYLSVLWVRHEDYYLSVTSLGNRNRYERSLVQYIIEIKIKNFLKDKHVDIQSIQFHHFDDKNKEHRFQLHGVEKLSAQEVAGHLSEIGAALKPHKNIVSEYVFEWPYSLNEDDIAYFDRHFKYLKLIHLRNFVEYRMPYFLAIFAVYSFVLL